MYIGSLREADVFLSLSRKCAVDDLEGGLCKSNTRGCVKIPGSFYTCSCERKMFIVAHFQQQSMT